MRAWLLAAVLCAPASAAVVEAPVAGPAASVSGSVGAAGAAVTSPIQPVPGVSVLAPRLNAAAVSAFPEMKASALPAGALRLAPPRLPAAAAAQTASPAAAPQAAPSARASKDLIPPPAAQGVAGPSGAAPARSFPDGDLAALSGRVRAAGSEGATEPSAAGPRAAGEAVSWSGRRLFDQAVEHAFLDDERPFAAGHAPEPSVAAAAAGGGVPGRRFASVRPGLTASDAPAAFAEGEALHDAVASPVPALVAGGAAASTPPGSSLFHGLAARVGAFLAPAPVAAPSPGPAPAFERLSLETGAGLSVKVRPDAGFDGASAAPFGSTVISAAPAARPGLAEAPVTSTEWLERRGLLETLSASEAAAVQTGAAAPASVAGRAAAALPPVPAPRRAPALPPLAWWGLAFLPAALAALQEL